MRNRLPRAAAPGYRRWAFSTTVAAAVGVLGLSLFGGGPIDRPVPPGDRLAEGLDALRGANDLVRATRADTGRVPALYPTAYGRLEAALAPTAGTPSAILPAALADLARTDALDTPAWRAHYVCLAMTRAPVRAAARVLERAGLRERAEAEALAYLRTPDAADDPLTSLATRAAFLRTLTCLGRTDSVPPDALRHLVADTAHTAEPVPVLYAVEALRSAGVSGRATYALRDAGARLTADCEALDPLRRAALALLHGHLPDSARACLLPALRDGDTQTRWIVRRALARDADRASTSLPPPMGTVRPDGLVDKAPAQLGTLTATYNAARALTAAGRHRRVPPWLKARLTELGTDHGLDPSDRILLAMICHRLSLSCGPQAAAGVRQAVESAVPARLTEENQRRWYGAMAARAEFGLGCGHTSAELPEEEGSTLSARSLRIVAMLASVGCEAQARRLTTRADLVAQAREALRSGDLPTASDAVEAALVSDRSIPQTLWDDLPGLLEPYRDPQHPDLYAVSPGGVASADGTRAAYHLLA